MSPQRKALIRRALLVAALAAIGAVTELGQQLIDSKPLPGSEVNTSDTPDEAAQS